jgi:DNA-binding PadR family transcriptional regulator
MEAKSVILPNGPSRTIQGELLTGIRLTPTSYIVLGLIEQVGAATPYELKGLIATDIGNFWSLQHTQLYAEPKRLTAAGYLTEAREMGGRRRQRYSLTKAGRDALQEWLREPATEPTELRDIALLKVYFGAAPAPLAAARLRTHREKLREYEELERELATQDPSGALTVLQAGIGHEREWIRYWSRLAGEAEDPEK